MVGVVCFTGFRHCKKSLLALSVISQQRSIWSILGGIATVGKERLMTRSSPASNFASDMPADDRRFGHSCLLPQHCVRHPMKSPLCTVEEKDRAVARRIALGLATQERTPMRHHAG